MTESDTETLTFYISDATQFKKTKKDSAVFFFKNTFIVISLLYLSKNFILRIIYIFRTEMKFVENEIMVKDPIYP